MATMVLVLGKDYCHTGIYAFYKSVAELLGAEITEDTRFDCTKLCVTKEVQDELISYYREKGSDNGEIGALLAQIGPKANVTASNPNGLTFSYVVIAEEGFITSEEEQEAAELSYRKTGTYNRRY